MSVATRWTQQRAFLPILERAALAHHVPLPIVLAVVGQESSFNPLAYRGEPQLGDGSYGLMQLLFSTAKGLGYTGDRSGLFVAETNAQLGAQLLAQLLRTRGSVSNALSAYNGGYRPALGFGAPARQSVTLCTKRDAKGLCIATRRVAPGEYGNQAYVDGVQEKIRYFEQWLQSLDANALDPKSVRVMPAGTTTPRMLFALTALGAAVLFLLKGRLL